MKALIKIFILLFILFAETFAQFSGHDWSFSFGFNYTTTSKIFLFPKSFDPVLRDQNVPLDDLSSYSVELRYRISEPVALGLGTEYLKVQEDSRLIVGGPSGSFGSAVKEGYSLIPINLTAYYILPFSTEDFKFQMGGGAGIYIGSHMRQLGSVETKTVSRKFAYGIHVSVGMEYMIRSFMSIRGAMKFRDPQFEMKSRYEKDKVTINGQQFNLSSSDIDTKVNIDGITFSIGLVFHFL